MNTNQRKTHTQTFESLTKWKKPFKNPLIWENKKKIRVCSCVSSFLRVHLKKKKPNSCVFEAATKLKKSFNDLHKFIAY